MGVGETYPPSPRSDRRHSITSASPIESLVASPIMSKELTSPSSDGSNRQRVSVRRNQEPPRNADDEIYCNHAECSNDPPTFRRPCEWNKHMDKHDRPYKCVEPGCDKIQGFTYSGGLLRHQREVHKKNISTRDPLFCPYPNCNRHSGNGFTRKENLNEHIRRRHVGESSSDAQGSPTITTPSRVPTLPLENMVSSSRKRKRTMESEVEVQDASLEDADDAETDDLRSQIKRLRSENLQKERVIEELRYNLQQKDLTIRHLNLAIESNARSSRG